MINRCQIAKGVVVILSVLVVALLFPVGDWAIQVSHVDKAPHQVGREVFRIRNCSPTLVWYESLGGMPAHTVDMVISSRTISGYLPYIWLGPMTYGFLFPFQSADCEVQASADHLRLNVDFRTPWGQHTAKSEWIPRIPENDNRTQPGH